MLMNLMRTLNKRNNTPEAIEAKFEATRQAYLKDLAKLRKKYANTFVDLTSEYNGVCSIQR